MPNLHNVINECLLFKSKKYINNLFHPTCLEPTAPHILRERLAISYQLSFKYLLICMTLEVIKDCWTNNIMLRDYEKTLWKKRMLDSNYPRTDGWMSGQHNSPQATPWPEKYFAKTKGGNWGKCWELMLNLAHGFFTSCPRSFGKSNNHYRCSWFYLSCSWRVE